MIGDQLSRDRRHGAIQLCENLFQKQIDKFKEEKKDDRAERLPHGVRTRDADPRGDLVQKRTGNICPRNRQKTVGNAQKHQEQKDGGCRLPHKRDDVKKTGEKARRPSQKIAGHLGEFFRFRYAVLWWFRGRRREDCHKSPFRHCRRKNATCAFGKSERRGVFGERRETRPLFFIA